MKKWLYICLVIVLLIGFGILFFPDARTVALGFMNDEPMHEGRPVSYWIQELDDEDPEARRQAAWCLGQIGDGAVAAVPALGEALTDEAPLVRVNVSLALFKIGPAAKAVVPALARALTDEVPFVRMNAALAFSRIGPDAREAVPALIDALKDEANQEPVRGFMFSVRQQAARALGKIGPDAREAVPALCEAVQDKDIGVSCCAVEALGAMGPEAGEAVKPLLAALNDQRGSGDRRVAQLAAAALKKIDPAAAAQAGVP